MLLLIDNYDRFTYNLAHYLGAWGDGLVIGMRHAASPLDGVQFPPETSPPNMATR